MQLTFRALGTMWWVEIFDQLTTKRRDEIHSFITSFVATFEQNYSRFKPDSMISKLNTVRSMNAPAAELVQLLQFGKQMYMRSDTRFNILLGAILESQGYNADYSFITSTQTPHTGNPITDLHIQHDYIALDQGNVDIGGYGKGYAIDLLHRQLHDTYDVREYLINGGGDMYATQQAGKPIEIKLEHPTLQNTLIGTTELFHQGFAASSPHKRTWTNTAGAHTHIVSPKLTSDATFVKAQSAAEADVFATVALQLQKPELETLIRQEKIAVAFYTADTNIINATTGFETGKSVTT